MGSIFWCLLKKKPQHFSTFPFTSSFIGKFVNPCAPSGAWWGDNYNERNQRQGGCIKTSYPNESRNCEVWSVVMQQADSLCHYAPPIILNHPSQVFAALSEKFNQNYTLMMLNDGRHGCFWLKLWRRLKRCAATAKTALTSLKTSTWPFIFITKGWRGGFRTWRDRNFSQKEDLGIRIFNIVTSNWPHFKEEESGYMAMSTVAVPTAVRASVLLFSGYASYDRKPDMGGAFYSSGNCLYWDLNLAQVNFCLLIEEVLIPHFMMDRANWREGSYHPCFYKMTA